MTINITKHYQAKPKISMSITKQKHSFTISTSITNHYHTKPRTSMTINKHYQSLPSKTKNEHGNKQALPTKTKQALPTTIEPKLS